MTHPKRYPEAMTDTPAPPADRGTEIDLIRTALDSGHFGFGHGDMQPRAIDALGRLESEVSRLKGELEKAGRWILIAEKVRDEAIRAVEFEIDHEGNEIACLAGLKRALDGIGIKNLFLTHPTPTHSGKGE